MGAQFTFVHCADLHLGSNFWGLAKTDPRLSERLRESTFQSLRKIVDVGIERSDFMVIAGDVFDDGATTPRTRLRFAKEMERYGKPVFVVRGNHDFRSTWDESIPFPPNVIVMRSEPDRRLFDVHGNSIEVVGMSYPSQHTSENIALKLRGTPGVFTVGLLHCSVTDIAGNKEYAPCAASDLLGRNVDYWALGHIHKRCVVRESDPAIVYPGNPQGRNASESGEKGCYVVSVDAGRPSLEFVPTQAVLWDAVEADITGMRSIDELVSDIRRRSAPGSIIALKIKGRGYLDRPLRADPDGFADTLAQEIGCSVDISSMTTVPGTERENGIITGSITEAAEKYRAMSEEELLELLCTSGPAKEFRRYLAQYAENGELRGIAEAAEASAIGRVTGGSR
ncbi:DNA repair exonuclease [Methanomassiliicoccaceae archaeon COG_1]|nr:DNA repair exonuclease [Methanomassiliicoccaceae archaeon COG_1]